MPDPLLGFLAPWLIYAGVFALHLALPARSVEGYARHHGTGAPLRYRLSGPLVLAITLVLWLAAGASGFMPWDWLWETRWWGATGALVLGAVSTAAVVLTPPAGDRAPPVRE